MQEIIDSLKQLGILDKDELDYIEGVLKSEPTPKTAKELATIIREARKYVQNKKET